MPTTCRQYSSLFENGSNPFVTTSRRYRVNISSQHVVSLNLTYPDDMSSVQVINNFFSKIIPVDICADEMSSASPMSTKIFTYYDNDRGMLTPISRQYVIGIGYADDLSSPYVQNLLLPQGLILVVNIQNQNFSDFTLEFKRFFLGITFKKKCATSKPFLWLCHGSSKKRSLPIECDYPWDDTITHRKRGSSESRVDLIMYKSSQNS